MKRTLSPRIRTIAALSVGAASVALYAVATYSLYDVLRTPIEVVEEKKDGIKSSTLRVQEKIATYYFSPDSVSEVFTMFDTVAAEQSVQITVDSVSNPQNAAKGPASPVQYIDVKCTLEGQLDAVLGAVSQLEQLPRVSRLIDMEVLEDKDAQAPRVRVTVRFYLYTNPQ